MKISNRILIFLVIIFLISLTQCTVKDDTFKIGQIWQYDTREGESNSTLTIVSMEKNKDYGLIIGVYIDNLNIPVNGMTGNTKINFLPFSKEALKKSITHLKGFASELPEYKPYYKAWKEELKKGNCKIFFDPVKQIIDTVQENSEKVFNK